MTLTLISVESDHYVYDDGYGNEVLLAGTGPLFREVVRWEDFDLEAAWTAAMTAARRESMWAPDRTAFILATHEAVADPESVEIVWCEACVMPTREENAVSIHGGGAHACESCFEDSYSPCARCSDTVHFDDLYYVMGGESVCSSCLDYYSHCEECEGYYHESEASEHRHGGCDCEPPTLAVTMRNDGDPMLSQDERVTIALPSGVISPEGIQSIARLVQNHGQSLIDWTKPMGGQDAAYDERAKWYVLAREIEGALGAQWQTKEGNYTKRLSKFAHKSQALKVPPALLSQVGCIARDNSTGVDFQVEITRDLNLPAEDFYHEDSCWWQSYSDSRCALKSNGGIGMRTFSNYGSVQGRAWIMPLKLDGEGDLQPTFDSLTPDAFMVFNGYGDLSGYTPARIVAHMAGMTYRKIGFNCSPMYVNNNSGYLVASEEIAARYYASGSLTLYVDTHSTLHHHETRELVTA